MDKQDLDKALALMDEIRALGCAVKWFPINADADLAEANDGELCTACGRDGLDCSRDPCAAVIADRAA